MFPPNQLVLAPIAPHRFDRFNRPTKDRYSSAGIDLQNLVEETIPPYGYKLVGTGIRAMIPHTHFLKIYDCSSFPYKYGAFVVSGIIDPDYEGEILVALMNPGPIPVEIPKGTKVAQMILHKIETPEPIIVTSEFREQMFIRSERGTRGFGQRFTETLLPMIEQRVNHSSDESHSSLSDEFSPTADQQQEPLDLASPTFNHIDTPESPNPQQ